VKKSTFGRISAELDSIRQKALTSEKRATAAEMKHEKILFTSHDLQETNSLLHKFSNVLSMFSTNSQTSSLYFRCDDVYIVNILDY
jgi:hypothetical protein